jgi:hypothetical protein
MMLEVGPVEVAHIVYIPWSFHVENVVFVESEDELNENRNLV